MIYLALIHKRQEIESYLVPLMLQLQ